MGMLGDIELIVITTEQFNMNNTVTDRTVEKGVNIADHIHHEPLTISFSAVIGNTENDPVLAEKTYQRLKQAREAEEVFSYIGYLDKFDNMAITALSPKKDAKSFDGFVVDIQLKQIFIAKIGGGKGKEKEEDNLSNQAPPYDISLQTPLPYGINLQKLPYGIDLQNPSPYGVSYKNLISSAKTKDLGRRTTGTRKSAAQRLGVA